MDKAYFLPPVHVNRVPMTRQLVADQDVLVLQSFHGHADEIGEKAGPSELQGSGSRDSSNQPAATSSAVNESSIPQPVVVQESDMRDDAALEPLRFCLQTFSTKTKEVLVGISQLKFGQYLGEPCFAPATAQIPRSSNLSPEWPKNWKQGTFDVLVIHMHYGFIICEVLSFGDNIHKLSMSQPDIHTKVRKKLNGAIQKLRKAEAMLSHLVSDIAPGLRITKTIAVPNLTVLQVQQAIADDAQLTEVIFILLFPKIINLFGNISCRFVVIIMYEIVRYCRDFNISVLVVSTNNKLNVVARIYNIAAAT